MRQGQDAELIEDVSSVRDGGKQPLEVILVNALREECNNSEEHSSIGSEFFEHGGVKRELDCGSEAPVMLGLQYTRPPLLPFLCQLTHVPLFLMPNCGKRRDRKWVEVELTRSDLSSLS